MMIRCVLVTALLGSLWGCSHLPDVDRALALSHKGDYQRAQSELQKLSDFGVPLAKLKLADLYIKIGGEDADERAEALYQEILLQDPRAYKRLAKIYRRKVLNGEAAYFSKAVTLFTQSTVLGDDDSFEDLIDLYLSNPQYLNASVPIEQWISKRESNGDIEANYDLARLYQLKDDGINRQEKIKSLCLPLIPSVAGCFDVLAKLYRDNEDDSALQALSTTLETAYHNKVVTPWFVYQYAIELSKGVKPYASMALLLHSEVAGDYPKAYMAMARLIVRNKQLGTRDELLSLVESRAQAGVPEAHYLMGRLYFHGDWLVQNPEKAVKHLDLVKHTFPGAMFLLGLIHKEGHLGRPNVGLALEYFLEAARAGSASADRELAEMYWYQKGVKRNPIYAYSFSLLAANEGSEGAKSLIAIMNLALTPEQRQKGEQRQMRERTLRKVLLAEKEQLVKQTLRSQLVIQE